MGVYLFCAKVLGVSEGTISRIKFLLSILNFAFFVYLVPKGIVFLFGISFGKAFEQRGQEIEKDVRDAANEKSRAQETFDSLRTRIEKISDEISSLVLDAQVTGDRFKKEILASARDRSENILKDGKLQAERETDEATALLKKDIIEMSIRLAVEKIRKGLTKSQHSRLIDESIGELKGL